MVAAGGGGGATPEVNIAVKHKGGARDDAAQIKPRLPHESQEKSCSAGFFPAPNTHITHS